MSSPSSRPTTSSVTTCARKTATDAPCAMCHTRRRSGWSQRYTDASPEDDTDEVRAAVVAKYDRVVALADGFAIHLDSMHASVDPSRILHANVIARATAPEVDLELRPRFGDTRIELQTIAAHPETEDPFEAGAIHPAG